MFSCRAEMIAARSRAFMLGSGWPILAATVISRASLLNSFDFLASCRPLRCMMFLKWGCPAMRLPVGFVRNGGVEGAALEAGDRPKSKIYRAFRYTGSVRCLPIGQLLTMVSRPTASMRFPLPVLRLANGVRIVSKASAGSGRADRHTCGGDADDRG